MKKFICFLTFVFMGVLAIPLSYAEDNVDVGALKDADFSKLKEPEFGKRDATSLISTANATSLTNSRKDLGVKGTDD